MSWTRTRILALLLFFSVAANLFFAGVFVGRLDGWHRMPFRDGPPPGGPISRMVDEALGQNIDPDLRAYIEGSMRRMHEERQKLRRSFKEVREVLGREPFDRQAYRASLDRLSDETDAMRDQTNAFMVDVMDRLTPEQRRRVIEFMDRRRPGGDRWGRD